MPAAATAFPVSRPLTQGAIASVAPLTSPGSGASSEAFGLSASAAGDFGTALGNAASAGFLNSIAVGAGAIAIANSDGQWGSSSRPTDFQSYRQFAFGRAGVATSTDTTASPQAIIGVTDTTAPRTVTLQTASLLVGRSIVIKDESGGAGTNNITIATEGSETIDGAASIAIDTDHGAVQLYSDGVDWFTAQSAGGAAFTGTEGSVLFAGVGGAIAEDNTNFFWNDTTNFLDIAGTISVSGGASDSEQFGISASAGIEGTAVGKSATAGTRGVAIGRNSTSSGANSFAGGETAFASGTGATALGKGAAATNGNTTAVGQGANASALSSSALGQGANAIATRAVAVGDADALSPDTVAVGHAASADGNAGTALGASSTVGLNSVAVGKSSTSTGTGSVAVGESATTVAFASAIAIGKGAAATGANDGQWGSAASPSDFNMYGDASIPGRNSVNGQLFGIRSVTGLLSGLTGATVSLASLIPAGSVPMGVTARVTTAITGATGFSIGDGVDPDRWGANIGVTLNTTSDNSDWTDPALSNFASANDVVLTAITSDFTAGAVRVTVHYMSPTAPTS